MSQLNHHKILPFICLVAHVFSNHHSKEEGKDEESIQSSNTHMNQDNTWESDKNTRKHHIQESEEVSPFPAGGHKAALNRHYSLTDTKHKITKRIHINKYVCTCSKKTIKRQMSMIRKYRIHMPTHGITSFDMHRTASAQLYYSY